MDDSWNPDSRAEGFNQDWNINGRANLHNSSRPGSNSSTNGTDSRITQVPLPTISTADISGSLQLNSQIGGFRTRARAGTLPSRFNGATPYPTILTNNTPVGNSSNSSGSTIPLNISPLLTPTTTGKDPLGDIFNFNKAPTPTTQTNTLHPNNGGKRLRSGSLFGFDSSIWSTNNSEVASMMSINTSKESLNQSLPTTQHLPDFSRIRSYTTTNGLSDKQYHLPYDTVASPVDQNLGQPLGNPEFDVVNDMKFQGLLNVPVENPRPRAQTYSENQYFSPVSELPQMPQNLHYQQKTANPVLVDNAKACKLEYTLTFTNATLSPGNSIVLLNLPPVSLGITSSVNIFKLLSNFGKINSVYVFEDKNDISTIIEEEYHQEKKITEGTSSIVEFETLEMAMNAKAQLNHKELYASYACVIGFAKIIKNDYVGSIEKLSENGENEEKESSEANSQVEHARKNLLLISQPLPFNEITGKLEDILTKFAQHNSIDREVIRHMIANASDYKGFDNDYGPLPDPIPVREFDAPKLREIRKLFDSNSISQAEVEEIALAMYDELPELSSDYIGNTVVQKIFESSSEPIKDVVLKKVAPYIAQMGIHKNGTWAGQKIINVANTNRQKQLIITALHPYVAPLFKDGFGNYLIQGCLKFGAHWNDFIVEVICSKFWLLAQDRYGSRAIRAALESGYCSIEQTSLITALIIVHAEFLAINNNGALLLTWFLDTCSLKNRHLILTEKLLPWLVELCYNKLGSLTILKILNNRNDLVSGEMIFSNIYGRLQKNYDNESDVVVTDNLKQILKEFTYGPTFIHKTLSTPYIIENNYRPLVIAQIKEALVELNVNSYQQGYKRLIDEVGLTHLEPRVNGNGNFNNRRSLQPVMPGVQTQNSSKPSPNNNGRFIPPPQFDYNVYPQNGYFPQQQSPYNVQFNNGPYMGPGMPLANQFDPSNISNQFDNLNLTDEKQYQNNYIYR